MACSIQEIIIQCYMGKQYLWNKADPDYMNRNKKLQALEEIGVLISLFLNERVTSNTFLNKD